MWRKMLVFLGVIAGLLLAYLLFWPIPIDPAAWKPPPAPALEGVYAPNSRLIEAQRIGAGLCTGPEDVAVDGQGRIYGGMADGRIMRFQTDGTGHEILADTGGRPLGLAFDEEENLVVADAYRGLLSVAPRGAITVLSTEADGVPFRLPDDVDIGTDGMIYFTDASSKFPLAQGTTDFLEHRPNGRLLAYDPRTRTTRSLLGNLYFANGVAVSPDQTFLLVVESGKYRVQRYWLKGPRRGQAEVFADNLPGIPDGISCNRKDTFWLALVGLRDPRMDRLLPHPYVRKILFRLQEITKYSPLEESYGFVLGLDTNGRVVHNLQDPSGMYGHITSVQEHGGMLYLASIFGQSIARLPVPDK